MEFIIRVGQRERLIFLVTEERTLLGKKEETKEIWNLDHFFKCILVYQHVWERERVCFIQCGLLPRFQAQLRDEPFCLSLYRAEKKGLYVVARNVSLAPAWLLLSKTCKPFFSPL